MRRKKKTNPNKVFLGILAVIIVLAVASFAYTSNPTGRGYGFLDTGLEGTGSGADTVDSGIFTSSGSCEATPLGSSASCSVKCPDGNTASVTCTTNSEWKQPHCDCSCKKEGSSPNDYWVAKCWCKE